MTLQAAYNARVLHMIPSFGEGGAERQLSLLAPALAARGFDCHVAFNEGGFHLGRVQNSAVTLHQLPPRSNVHPARISDLISLIRKVKPCLIQTWLTQMDVAGGLTAQLLGYPHILSERASGPAYPRNWKNRLRSAIGRRAAAIVANSQSGMDYWEDQGVQCPVLIIPNAVVTEHATIEPAELAPLAGARILLAAGRLDPQKNVGMLIAAFDLALNQLPDHVAILFGDGPELGAVQRQVARCRNADRIQLQGFTRHLGYWRQQADVFVSVSDYEGQPNVVLEAAYEECPLVISDIPEHRECLSSGAAMWVDRRSPSSIADGIVKIVLDTEFARNLTLRAQADVSRYTLDSQVELYCRTYSGVIAGECNISFPLNTSQDAKWTV